MGKYVHRRNTWETCRQWREQLTQDNVDHDTVLDGHQSIWEVLEFYYNGDPTTNPVYPSKVINRDDDERTAKSPLDAFMYYMEAGFIPPPEILFTLVECFQLYLESAGNVSLENIFFGKEVPGIGNYSARENRRNLYLSFAISFRILNHDNYENQISAASQFIADKGLEIDPETFLRNFRRWRSSEDPTGADD